MCLARTSCDERGGFAPLAAVMVIGVLGYLAQRQLLTCTRGGPLPWRRHDALPSFRRPALDGASCRCSRACGRRGAILCTAPPVFQGARRGDSKGARSAPSWQPPSRLSSASCSKSGCTHLPSTRKSIERYAMYAFPPLLVALAVCLGQGLESTSRRDPRGGLCARLRSPDSSSSASSCDPKRDPSGTVFASLTLSLLHSHSATPAGWSRPGPSSSSSSSPLPSRSSSRSLRRGSPACSSRLPSASCSCWLRVSAYVVLAANTRYWVSSTGPVRSWIDDRIGSSPGTAGYLFVPGTDSYMSSTVLANNQFWNRSIDPVYTHRAPRRSARFRSRRFASTSRRVPCSTSTILDLRASPTW